MLKEREKYYIKLINESESLIDVCRKAGIVPTTGNYDTLKRVIKENNVDISHFKRLGGTTNNVVKKDTIEYLVEGSKISSFRLKNKLLKEGYKEHRCEKCNNTEWYGRPIPLELHHINGDNTDNRLENLQMLCPNCHAFTDNYGGKNQKSNIIKRYCKTCGKELHSGQKVYCSVECRHKKYDYKMLEKCTSIKDAATKAKLSARTIKKITEKENDKKVPLIIESLKRTKSFTRTAKEFGVSDNAIKKILVKRGYPGHIKDLLAFIL